ncbi:Receptor-like protein kinase 7 [Ranunculus cassubicifolius]
MSAPVNIFPPYKQFLFLLTLLFSISFSKSDELAILLNLKSSLQSSNSPVFDTWKKPDISPCNFSGVWCNSQHSVSKIDLSGKQLSGFLQLDSICELPSLEILNLGSNFLYGTISPALNNCTKLKNLDLSANSFSGTVPDFSALVGLTSLHLNSSGFSGEFPWRSLENLTFLETLSLGDNSFDNFTFPSEILKLNKLSWLYLTNCSLEGKIPPEIGNLTELVNLELSYNSLTGPIPAEIGKLQKLWQLEMYYNYLSGEFPVGFGNLANLEKFDASGNQLEGDLSELKYLRKLTSLQLFENQLTGTIPEEFGDFKYLVNLSLYTNMLTGSLPRNLGSWADFDFIDVSTNLLTGPIPPDMCKRGKMTALLILENKFTGGIPETYGSCLSMNRFRVSNNSLAGVVPAGLWGLPNLDFIDLDMNHFEGPITSDIGNAKMMTQLHLSSNRFSGELPEEISKASSLVLIDVSSNQFSGMVPAGIGELKKLNSLYLQENMFHGSIPASIGSCSFLNNINLASNLFTDGIPASLGSLPSLNSLNLSHNQLSKRIPESLSNPKLSLLDLSHNRLTGPIPKSLSNDAYNGSFAGNSGLCSPDIRYFRPCSSESSKSDQLRNLVTCFLVGLAVLLVCLGSYLFLKKKRKDEDRSLKSDSWNVKSFSIVSFTEQDILGAIRPDNIIGTGGSGNVYRVDLGDGKDFAVKHIWNSDSAGRKNNRSTAAMLMKRSGNMPEFDAEVETLSSIRHVNVVKLFCSITSEDSSLLVYEYLPNGSLWDRLHTCNQKTVLDWETRYDIAVGAAKGLEYLHHGCDRPVIHRDVKSSNILLDEFFKPRIADFGLAKIVLQANSATAKEATARVITGTHGYIAPEYAYTYKVNEKSDVYSFGVVLMELVTGKKPIHEPEFGDNKDIVHWISTKMTSKETVLGVVDSSIPEHLKEDVIKVLRVAVLCTAKLPALRPSMRKVVQMLEDAEPLKLIGITIGKGYSIEKDMQTK